MPRHLRCISVVTTQNIFGATDAGGIIRHVSPQVIQIKFLHGKGRSRVVVYLCLHFCLRLTLHFVSWLHFRLLLLAAVSLSVLCRMHLVIVF